MDKSSVLGEAIKYMKQLQEKEKILEEVVAKRTVDSVVVVTKSQLTINNDDNDSSSAVEDSCASGNGGRNSSSDRHNHHESVPEIEVNILGLSLHLRVCCEEQNGILPKLFTELDKYDVSVTNCSVMSLEGLDFDITIVAQMERNFKNNIKDFIRSLRSVLRSRSHFASSG